MCSTCSTVASGQSKRLFDDHDHRVEMSPAIRAGQRTGSSCAMDLERGRLVLSRSAALYGDQQDAGYLQSQPFGQVPIMEERAFASV